MSEWGRFFAFRLPIVVLAVELVVELLAAVLSGVPLHRHNVDDLASEVLTDRGHYTAVLLGDSVTHNVVLKYRIGDVGEVADLTTHAKAGLPSFYFVLRRYLNSGHRPKVVMIATSSSVLVDAIDPSTFRYYVASTFRLPEEKAFLQQYYGDLVDYHWQPAALNMTTRLGEPLFSLLRHPGTQFHVLSRVPPTDPALDVIPDYVEDKPAYSQMTSKDYAIRPEARAVMSQICGLGKQYGIPMHFLWAPMPMDAHKVLMERGVIQKMGTEIISICAAAGWQMTVDDTSAVADYPYFNPDLIHIRGDGWEQLYANQLKDFTRKYEPQEAAQH